MASEIDAADEIKVGKTSSRRKTYSDRTRTQGELSQKPDDARPIYRALGFQLRTANREMLIALQKRIADHGLTVAMSIFLRCLWEEDGLTQRELARRAKLVEGTTTDILQQMEMKGLIVRVRNIVDRRKINIYLTQPAKNLLVNIRSIHMELDAMATQDITPEEMRVFLKVIEKITDNLAEDNNEDSIDPSP